MRVETAARDIARWKFKTRPTAVRDDATAMGESNILIPTHDLAVLAHMTYR